MKKLVLNKNIFYIFIISCFHLKGFARINKNYYVDRSVSQSFKIEANIDKESNSKRIQLICHGKPGFLLLENKWLDAQGIVEFINHKFRNKAKSGINIYGCDFAKGKIGIAAVRYLENKLGVEVAASNNITGKGGDWILEVGQSNDVINLPWYTNNLQCSGFTYGATGLTNYNTSTAAKGNIVNNGAVVGTVEWNITSNKSVVAPTNSQVSNAGTTVSSPASVLPFTGSNTSSFNIGYAVLPTSTSPAPKWVESVTYCNTSSTTQIYAVYNYNDFSFTTQNQTLNNIYTFNSAYVTNAKLVDLEGGVTNLTPTVNSSVGLISGVTSYNMLKVVFKTPGIYAKFLITLPAGQCTTISLSRTYTVALQNETTGWAIDPSVTPPTSISATSSTLCKGSSTQLKGVCSSGTLTWYNDAALNTSIGTGTNLSVIPTNLPTTTYYASCVDNTSGCQSTYVSIPITVNDVPATAPTNIVPPIICSGSAATLTGTCPTGSTLATFSNSALTTVVSNPTGNLSTTTTFYVACKQTVGGCLSSGIAEIASVLTAPTALSFPDICLGSSSLITGTCASGTLAIYASNTSTTPLTNPVTPSATTTYSAACTNGSCNSTSVSDTVKVANFPSAPNTGTALITYCKDETAFPLRAIVEANTRLLWYTSESGGTGSTTAPTPSTASIGTTIYYVSSQLTNGPLCESLSRTAITVTVKDCTCPDGFYESFGNGLPTNVRTSLANAGLPGSSTSLTMAAGLAIGNNEYAIVSNTPNGSYWTTGITDPVNAGGNFLITSPYATPPATFYSSPTFTNWTIGHTYEVSFYAINGGKTAYNPLPNVQIKVLNANGSITYLSVSSGSLAAGVSNWTKVSGTFIASSTTGKFILEDLVGGKSSGDDFAVDEIRMVDTTPIAISNLSASNVCLGGSTTLSASCTPSNSILNWYSDSGLINLIGTGNKIVSPTSTTTYYGQCENATCLSPASSITVNVNPIPIVVAQNNQVVCSNSNSTAINFSGTPTSGVVYNWINSNSAIGLATSGVGDIPSFVAINNTSSPITSTITVTPTYTSGGITCSGTSKIFTITVNPKPATPIISGTSKICNSGSTTLTTSSACTGGIVSWTDGTNSIVGTGSTLIVSPTATTSYTATCKTATCSSTSSAIFTITVIEPPTAATLSGSDVTICSGNTASLSVSGCTGSLIWSSGESTSSITTVALTATSSYTATCTVTGTSPCADAVTMKTINVTVIEPPTAATLSGSDVTICSGNTASLSVSGCTGSLIWSSGESTSSITTAALTATSSYTATCTVTGTSPCADAVTMKTINVTVIEPPTAATLSGSDVTICSGNTASLSVSGCTGNLIWSSGESTSSITTAALTTSSSYTATCTVTGTSPCADAVTMKTINVTVIEPPTVATLSGSDVTICSGNTASLSVSGCTGSLIWSSGESTSSITTAALTATSSYTATCTVTGTSPCADAITTKTLTLTVIEPPTAATLSGSDVTICSGNTASLSVSGCTGSLIWSSGESTSSITTAALTATSSYTATCTVTGTSPCADAVTMKTINVTVIEPPTAATLSGSDVTICSGNTASLSVSGCTGNLIWSSGESTSSITTAALTTSSSYTATCTVTGTSPCADAVTMKTINVTVIEPPTAATLSGSDVTICSGNTASLSVSGCTGSLIWSSGESTSSITTAALTATSSYTATCTVTGTSPCADAVTMKTINVTVIEPPTAATLSGSDVTICSGNTASLSVSGCTGSLIWSSGESTSSITTAALTATSSYTATCTVTGTSPCADAVTMKTINVTVIEPPTAATLSGSDVTICSGNTASLSVSGCTGSLIWSSGESTSSITTAALTATSSYTATCTVTGTSPCADAVTMKTINVTVIEPPTAATLSGSDVTICSGNTASLSVSGCTGNLIWSSGESTRSITTAALTATASYTATCTVTGTSPCADAVTTKTLTVTVIEPPTAATLSGSDVTICSGNTASLSVSGCTGSLIWSSGESTSSITTAALTATASYTATCTVIGTSPCADAVTTKTLTVTIIEPATAATLSGSDVTICSGNTASLSVSGCTGSLIWSSGESTSSITTAALTATSSYTATCTVTGSSPCSDAVTTKTLTVTVIEPPTAATLSGSDVTICSGNTASLSISGCTGSLKWSTGESTSSITTAALTASSSYTATCTVAGTSSCADAVIMKNINVTVIEPPTAATLSGSDVTICSGNTASLSVSGCTGSLIWSSGESTSSITTAALTATSSYTATCTVTGTSPCADAVTTKTISVTVIEPPTAATLSGSEVTICSGNTASLSVSGCTGSLIWSSGESTSSITTAALTATSSYTATCTVTGSSPCSDAVTTKTLTVTVIEPPTAATLSGSDVTICSGNTASLSVSGCTGSLIWSSGESTSSITTAALTATSSYTATCTVTGTSPCADAVTTKTISVTVIEPPTAPTLSGSEVTICSGNTASLSVSGCTGSLIWSSGESTSSITTAALTANSSYTATCTVTGTSPCAVAVTTKTINVTVIEPPEKPSISINSPTICSGGTAVLTVSGCSGSLKWNTGETANSITTNVLTVSTTYSATCTISSDNFCQEVAATVEALVTVSLENSVQNPSVSTVLCISTLLPTITISTTGATGIGTPTGLPLGLTAIWDNNIITISGTPTNSGTFNYNIPLNGGCGIVFASGIIIVNEAPQTPIIGTITQPSCNLATGSFLITNYNSSNTYTFSPLNSINVNSDGLVTSTANLTFNISVNDGNCSSLNSANIIIDPLPTCTVNSIDDNGILNPNSSVTVNVLSNDTNIIPSTVRIIDPVSGFFVSTLDVPGGHWDVNTTTGEITYTQTDATKGLPEPINYSGSNINGQTTSSKVTLTTNSALYVTLIDFYANIEENKIKINWSTASEFNADKFVVLVSDDAKIFRPIGEVIAIGNSDVKHRYYLYDEKPQIGINYYRLQSIDLDGSKQLSNIVAVKYDLNSEQLNIWPNPIRYKSFNLTINKKVSKLVLVNINGQELEVNYVNLNLNSVYSVDIPNYLDSGIYFLKIYSDENKMYTKKIVLD